jgi:hypothetical protein
MDEVKKEEDDEGAAAAAAAAEEGTASIWDGGLTMQSLGSL